MMKYLLFALAVTAISAQFDSDLDAFLEEDDANSMELPCTPKLCVPVCKPVTKTLSFGGFSIKYVENVCGPDAACEKANVVCMTLLNKLMQEAQAAAKVMEDKYSAAQVAKGNKATKDAAAAAAKKEEAAAKSAMDLAHATFRTSEQDAATKASNAKSATAASVKAEAKMSADLKKYESTKAAHLKAVAAHEGAKSAAAAAAAAYDKALKEHCDAEAQHAAAVKKIDHPHLAQKKCTTAGGSSRKICGKTLAPKPVPCSFKAGDTVKMIKTYNGQKTINVGDLGTVYCGSSSGMVGVVWHKDSTKGHSNTGACKTGTTGGHCSHGDQMWYVRCPNIAKA